MKIRLILAVLAVISLAPLTLYRTPLAASAINKITPIPMHEFQETAACNPSGHVAAALRNDGQGWHAVSDETHQPINVAKVSTDINAVTIEFTFTAKKIGSFVVTPDETLATSGIIAGASVNTRSAIIHLAKTGPLPKRLSPALVSTRELPWSNLWVFGTFEIDCPT